MATTDKRKLELEIKADDKASRPLKNIGDAADDAKDDLRDLNQGLKKLDESSAEATASIAKLRKEIAETGDLELVKDLAKQEQRLKALARQRKLLLGEDDGPRKGLALPDVDVDRVGVGIGARLGPIVVQSLGRAVGSAGPGIAIGAPIVAGVATWLTSAAGGAVLAGAAVGAVAGGVAVAARDPRVQAAGAELATSIGSQLERAAAPFVPATLRAIGTVRAGFSDLGGDLEDIFADAADYVDPLVRAVLGLAREAAPGFRRLVQAAAPVVDMLRRELPELGEDIGAALDSISDGAPGAARALGLLLDVAGAGIRTVGGAVELASKAFMLADVAAQSFRGPKAAAEAASKYAVAASEAERESTDWSGALDQLGAKAVETATEVESLTEMVDRLTSQNLSAENSAIALEEAIDAAGERAKEGAKGIDINTKSGRENRKALLEIASAAKASAADILEMTGSQELASAATERGRSQFLKLAASMGVSKKEAIALANQLFGLPSPKPKVDVETKKAEAEIRRLKARMADIDRNVLIKAHFRLIKNDDIAMALRLGRLSAGGPVEGPGPKGVDSQPYLLAPGEYVLSSRDVDKLGGAARIDEWRKGLHDVARPAAVAGSGMSGGRGGGQQPIVINAASATPLERMFASWALGAFRNAGLNVTAINN